MPRDTSDRSRRRDTSDSSDSEYSQKSSKKKHRIERSRRSRSREKSSSYRNRRSSSRSKKKSRRSVSRSPSRYYNSRRRSPSRDRHARRRSSRSVSKDRSESYYRESSEYSSRSKHKSSHSSHKTSKNDSRKRSSSRSLSPYSKDEVTPSIDISKKYIVDDTESKIKKAIKAAEAVGLTMCKLPSYEYKEVEVKEDMPTIQDRNVLDELNSESFAPKQFLSSRSKKVPENIVIDLDSETVKLTDVEIPKAESLFHPEISHSKNICNIYKDLTHRQLMEITTSSLDTILRTDSLLSDTPSDITLEEVLLKIAVEHGQSITVNVLRDNDIPINVIIPQSGSTVCMLKKAIRRSFEFHLRRTKTSNIKISWRYIWRTYFLEHDGLLLTNDNGLIVDYGVVNRSTIKFTKKQKKKQIFDK